MALTVSQSATAVAPRVPASFLGKGGVEPYLYEVLPGGAGGTIDPDTGAYTAPDSFSSDPAHYFDTIRVADYAAAVATARIAVWSPLMLFCDVVQKGMGLADGRVYLWDQKIEQPKDNDLYVVVSLVSANAFGSSNRYNKDTDTQDQFVTMQALLDVDLKSRGPAARDRKEEFILALDSDYARFQQDANSFYIGKLDSRFVNLSEQDGAAIPYRYKVSVHLQYVYTKTRAAQFYDQFSAAQTNTDP